MAVARKLGFFCSLGAFIGCGTVRMDIVKTKMKQLLQSCSVPTSHPVVIECPKNMYQYLFCATLLTTSPSEPLRTVFQACFRTIEHLVGEAFCLIQVRPEQTAYLAPQRYFEQIANIVKVDTMNVMRLIRTSVCLPACRNLQSPIYLNPCLLSSS